MTANTGSENRATVATATASLSGELLSKDGAPAPAKKSKRTSKNPPASAPPARAVMLPSAGQAVPRGRKTDYRPEYCDQIIEYFNRPAITRRQVLASRDADGNETYREEVEVCDLPTFAEFATIIGVHRDTVLEWQKVNPEFAEACKLAKEHQERILITNGMHDRYAQPFAIFAAKNLIGWTDRQHLLTTKVTLEQLVNASMNLNAKD